MLKADKLRDSEPAVQQHRKDADRPNVSTSLRELITWGVVRRVHIIGDRRDRFEALKDVMETFRVIMAERKRREMDPTIALLEHCVREAKSGGESEQYTREQLEKMTPEVTARARQQVKDTAARIFFPVRDAGMKIVMGNETATRNAIHTSPPNQTTIDHG